ncbi:hypothetical protein [Limnoglobus roseus]|uniref:Uncharacterized protein n=1 Tax=Limnoglobus roseus TaxID=2598579 RepID=A0A5C1A6G4_9BACT|nr:hypothetical protein [Limnoglobus roseus]QEL14320.1 hypothetical protein PX52LOC_01200 [Limnoglobus roseus]
MTAAEFDAVTIWSLVLRPPRGWDGKTAYLLRDGVIHCNGEAVRAYQFSDGTRLVNNEDLARAMRNGCVT